MAKVKWGEADKPRTASETVYEILHRNIINLNLVPGTVMSEKEISEKMEVSRTPVREAFIKLSNEALVDVVPQKGSFVSKINLLRVKEERFLRESLETAVVEDLIQHCEDLDMSEAYRYIDLQEDALSKEDHTRFMELDDDFHHLLFSMAGKSMCHNVIMNFSSHYRRVRYLSMSVRGVSISNLSHHRRIVQLIEERNLKEAIKAMKVHLRKLNIEKDAIYEQFRDYFDEAKAMPGSIDLVDEKKLFEGMGR